jgi:hypothetical protein
MSGVGAGSPPPQHRVAQRGAEGPTALSLAIGGARPASRGHSVRHGRGHLRRIDQLNRELNAYVLVTAEQARARARDSARRSRPGAEARGHFRFLAFPSPTGPVRHRRSLHDRRIASYADRVRQPTPHWWRAWPRPGPSCSVKPTRTSLVVA